MFFIGLGTATPPARYDKAACWEAFQRSTWYSRLTPRSRALVHAVLKQENGIESRYLALDSLDEVFRIDPDTLRQRFLTAAPALAARAAARALAEARLAPECIEAVIVTTCTGYLCPGLSGHVIERLGLRPETQAFDLVGQGCAAALPSLRLADALLGSQIRHALTVSVEVSSAAMYLDDDPGVLVSACLFGDGAGAAVLSRAPPPHGRRIGWSECASLIEPRQRGALQFEQRGGLLRNVLTREVPQLAAAAVQKLLEVTLERARLSRAQIGTWLMHAGGRDVLTCLRRQLGLADEDLRFSAATLREYGNLSSAFMYFVLQAALADRAPAGWWWLCSFGAGFSCHGALLEVA